MKKHFKWIALAIITTIVLQVYMPAATAFETDEHFKSLHERESTMALYRLNIIVGFEDQTFRPAQDISRAEFVTILVRMMGLQHRGSGAANPFWDVANDYWAIRYIRISAEQNFVAGFPDNSFRPGGTITYAEAVAVLVRILGYGGQVTGNWPWNYLNKANAISLTPNLRLYANTRLTRGDAFVLIADALMAQMA